MFDFLGRFALRGQPLKPAGKDNPFQYLEASDKICFQRELLDWEGVQLTTLSGSGASPDAFSGSRSHTLIYGNCYGRLNGAGHIEPKKLKAGDLAKLLEQGNGPLHHAVKGSYILIHYDREKENLRIIADPLNLRSLYYYHGHNELVFSSSLTAMTHYLAQSGKSPAINRRAVLDLLLFDYILDHQTYIKHVDQLAPGHRLEASKRGIFLHPDFDPFAGFDLSGPQMDQHQGAGELTRILARIVDQHDEGPEKTAVALTGGFDSRSILASLGDRAPKYQTFSYGRENSWDLDIPQIIASRLGLRYMPIYLDEPYRDRFEEYARLSVSLSDGLAGFEHANVAYVYANYLKDKTSMLTGLFGSELIKQPTSRGLFYDENIITLLEAKEPGVAVREIITEARRTLPLEVLELAQCEEELIETVREHPYLHNELPANEKYFHYILMTGMRKYFSKEIKIQKPWIDNLHPFLDMDFIRVLLKTPFPWVYNFSKKKSLLKNLSIHRVYGKIIDQNPVLSGILSTHGYRPRHLLRPWELPLVGVEYALYKKKIRRSSHLDFSKGYAQDLVKTNHLPLFRASGPANGPNMPSAGQGSKSHLKLASLQFWLNSVGLSL